MDYVLQVQRSFVVSTVVAICFNLLFRPSLLVRPNMLTVCCRRHADRTAQLWLQKLKDSSSHKRLSLIYLANGKPQANQAHIRVTVPHMLLQKSRSSPRPVARKNSLSHFRPPSPRLLLLPTREHRMMSNNESVEWSMSGENAVSSKGLSSKPSKPEFMVSDATDLLLKVLLYLHCTDLDKARGSTKAGLGGSIFGSASSFPAELTSLVAPQQNVSKVALSTKPVIKSANTDYAGLMAPGSTVPSAPVYAARLSGLLKTLAQAEGAVEQSVNARRELVSQLQKLLDTNRNALIADENELENVMQKKLKVEDKKEEVERAIMAGLPNDEPYPTGNSQDDQPAEEPDRPEVEALTPLSNDEEEFEPEPNPAPEFHPEDTVPIHPAPTAQTLPAIGSPYKSVATSANGAKKRRLEDTSDFPDLGGDDGIDADVAEMLRKDSNSN